MRTTLRALRTLAPPLGYYLLTLALLAGVLGLDLGITRASRGSGVLVPAEVWGISSIVACLLLYGLFAGRGAGRDRPVGLRVSRQQQPDLWRLVERTAEAAGVRAPHTLRLADGPELTLRQGSQLLGLLPGRRHLCIGAPLLVGLTEQQLAALLAQRLGPARDADTPVPGLLRRNRATLVLVLQRYGDTSGAAPGPRRWFGAMYTGYARNCLRWSAPDARRLALAADRTAARIAGRDTTVAALRDERALTELHHHYQYGYVRIGWDEGAYPLPAAVVPGFRDWLHGPTGQQSLERLENDPPRERIPQHDARPPLAERIARLQELPPGPPPGPSAPAESLLSDPQQTYARVVAAAPGVAERRQLPWDDLAGVAGQAELDAAAAGLLTSVASVLRHRPPDLPTILDAIDEGRWAELADWIPRTGAARTVPVAVGRSLNLSTATEGLHALVLGTLVRQGQARWTLDWRHGLQLNPTRTTQEALDAAVGPALDAATASPPDTAPLRLLLQPEQESPPPAER